METLLTLIIWAVFFWGYKVAENNGRDTTLAAIICFLFGIFGVIGYYIAGKKEKKIEE